MGEYYENSTLTIALFSQGTPRGGFLGRRTSLGRQADKMVRLPYRDKAGKARGSFYVQWHAYMISSHFAQLFNTDLLQRGWVFQEWLLSRRILYFPEPIYFECRTKALQNEFNEGCLPSAQSRSAQGTSESDQIVFLKELLSTGEVSIQELWIRIIERYSRLSLTKGVKDRLLAISGIAAHVRKMIIARSSQTTSGNAFRAHAYVSGWWLEDIHTGLLWEPVGLGDSRYHPGNVPSWSWARWGFGVRWRQLAASTTTTPSCEITHIKSGEGTAPEDPFSQKRYLATGPGPQPVQETDEYLVVNDKFACLGICGKVAPVLLGKLDPDQGKIHAGLAKYTGVSLDQDARRRWLGICRPDAPDELIGWADLDYHYITALGFRDKVRTEKPVIIALHVSTQTGVEGGWQFGRRSSDHEVYAVLFIFPLFDGHYGRIGVGRIFQQGFFNTSETSNINLI